MHVPEAPVGLDANWLREALGGVDAFLGARILGVEPSVIGTGYGLDGIVARLALRVEGGAATGETSLVAKFASAETGREEIGFYEHVAPNMPIPLPTFYAGFVADEADRAVLLLEDLTGAVQGDTLVGASRAQSETVLRAAARFHAEFHGGARQELAHLPLWEGRAAGLCARLEARTARFLERYSSRVDERVLTHVADLPRSLPEAARVLEAAPRTLIHADLHADNVLFRRSDEAVILDWPHASRGPAMLDVVRFLVEGTRLEVRRRHGSALLEDYWDAREALGAGLPRGDRAVCEYEAAVTWYLGHAVAWAGAEDPGFHTPRVRPIVDALVRNTTAAMLDL